MKVTIVVGLSALLLFGCAKKEECGIEEKKILSAATKFSWKDTPKQETPEYKRAARLCYKEEK